MLVQSGYGNVSRGDYGATFTADKREGYYFEASGWGYYINPNAGTVTVVCKPGIGSVNIKVPKGSSAWAAILSTPMYAASAAEMRAFQAAQRARATAGSTQTYPSRKAAQASPAVQEVVPQGAGSAQGSNPFSRLTRFVQGIAGLAPRPQPVPIPTGPAPALVPGGTIPGYSEDLTGQGQGKEEEAPPETGLPMGALVGGGLVVLTLMGIFLWRR